MPRLNIQINSIEFHDRQIKIIGGDTIGIAMGNPTVSATVMIPAQSELDLRAVLNDDEFAELKEILDEIVARAIAAELMKTEYLNLRRLISGAVRRNLEAVIADLEGQTNMNWQPIDTAPKDGRLVMAWREGWTNPSWVRWVFNDRTQTTFWNDSEEWDEYELESEPPTHWIELPPLPNETRGKR